MAGVDVDVVNLDGYVVLSDGEILPITRYFDEDGEDCDPDEAVVCIAGTDAFGWLTIDIGTRDDAPSVH